MQHCFKDTPRNKEVLGGLVSLGWPLEERTKKEKAKLMMKQFKKWKNNKKTEFI